VFGSHKPVQGQTLDRAKAALGWLLLAQDRAGDGGIAYGYFPCDVEDGWRASYPETTGYIIPTLLDSAELFGDEELARRALRAAEWEISVQMPSGAVQGGIICAPSQQTPAAFNTGMVLHGWTAAFRATDDKKFLIAARRAAEFLVGDLAADGYFRTNGQFVAPDAIKTYNCLCAWALYRLGEDTREERYQRAAVTVIEAALRQQQANGWFANNCLTRPEAPLVHTIAYTLQGILEVALLSKRADFVAAVQRGLDPLLAKLSPEGFLPGRFYSSWEPAAISSCLTGCAQVAIVSYRLAQNTGQLHYGEAGDRLVNFLKAMQETHSSNPAINGALPGSFPLFGEYMAGGYPNWATKYLLDALLLQLKANPRRS
jgi:uncharacterized protein YyaL (SSP411 family)